MAQPAQATGMANVVIIGTTGSGKSTLANLLVFGSYQHENGFHVGHGNDADTQELKSVTGELDGCVLQVTDTPGVPDTNREISLDHYDEIVKHVRQAPSINAIIIMVAEGRKDGPAYKDMQALMKHFRLLPCAKFMVFRSNPPTPGCTVKEKDERAVEDMNNLCERAGLNTDHSGRPAVMKRILHYMDSDDVKRLREEVCKMPGIPQAGLQLRTFSEMKAHFQHLSHENSRVEALVAELRRLSAVRAANDAVVEKMTRRLQQQEKVEQALEDVFGLFSGSAAEYAVYLSRKLTGFWEAKEIADARAKEIAENMARMQAEVDEGQVDQEALKKAEAEVEALNILGGH